MQKSYFGRLHQQRVGRCESLGYWMCCRRVAQHLRACVRAGEGHFEHITGWAVAQTCCISQCAKYRKSVIL